MEEKLRKPTTGETPPINSSPDLSIVQEEGKEHEVVEEKSDVSPPVEAKPEIAVETIKKVRKKRKPRKKKAAKVNPMSLTKIELMALDLNQARVDMQATVLQNLQMKEKMLNAEYIQQRDHIRGKQRQTITSLETCKEDYNQTRAEIQERLGISLDNCTVRQDGVVIPVDKDGNPEFIGEDV